MASRATATSCSTWQDGKQVSRDHRDWWAGPCREQSHPRADLHPAGASRGLGLAITEILLQRFNASVVAVSRSVTDGLSGLSKEKDGRLAIVQGDVTDEQVAKRACDTATQRFGRLDGVVLNAGIAEPLCACMTLACHMWTLLILPARRLRRGRLGGRLAAHLQRQRLFPALTAQARHAAPASGRRFER